MEVTFTFITTIPKKVYTITVELTQTIDDIKQKLSEVSGYPVDWIHLNINNSADLQGDTLLSDYDTSGGVDVSLW